jgi:hypothetical protein
LPHARVMAVVDVLESAGVARFALGTPPPP